MIIDSLKYNGACPCGKEHAMETVFSVVESGCLFGADKYFKKYGIDGVKVVVYDENTYKAVADRRPHADFEVVLDPNGLHADEHGVDMLMSRLPENCDCLIAVGSGTVHDITRYCAYSRGIDFVSCPTAASVDGFCSSVAAMTWHGCKKTLTAVAPKLVIADIDIIKNAPIRLARSGFGDMIGKYVALTDWKISNILTGEHYCERIADITRRGAEAVVASAEGIVKGDAQAYTNLMYGLLMSGLAMQMLGNSRPASGAEHHISHIIEMSPRPLGLSSDALHGEKVGVGTLIAIGEYYRIAQGNHSFCDYAPFEHADIQRVFGPALADEIINENKADAALGITGARMSECFLAICDEIGKMPTADSLKELYRSLGIVSSLADIGVDNGAQPTLVEWSPAVRNRVTLMRLRRCFC